MEEWLVGVDAGGTRTRALAANPHTGGVLRAEGEGSNWTVHGPDLCRERIGGVVSRALPQRAELAALCLCIAGYYPPDHREAAEAWAGETWPGSEIRIETDVLGAWAGAHGTGPGVVLISGTGSICYGQNSRGEEARAGGWGPLFGDQGSAYSIGITCLRALAEMEDGIGPPTALAGRVQAEHPHPGGGADLRSWLRGIYRHGWGREQVAGLAVQVVRVAEEGDAVAGGILEGAAEALAQVALAVERRLEEAGLPLALQGGMGASSILYNSSVRRSLAAHGSRLLPAEPESGPVEGALLLAAKAWGGAEGVRRMRAGLP
jgi:N-acetylmuramic acid 6-phosphate etherase